MSQGYCRAESTSLIRAARDGGKNLFREIINFSQATKRFEDGDLIGGRSGKFLKTGLYEISC